MVSVPVGAGFLTEFGHWLRLPSGVCAGVPLKCGNTTVRSALGVRDWFSPREVVRKFPDSEKWLVVRDPVERFASLWRDKCRDGGLKHLAGKSPDELIGLIESWPMGDKHWFPQFGYLVPGVELVTLPRFMSRLGIARRDNATVVRQDDPDMPEARVRAHYARDVAMWESAQC